MPSEALSPPALLAELQTDRPAKIEVFGYDVAEISQIRRIRAFHALGHDVHSFTMRRENMLTDFTPDWSNTHLYVTENENLLKRAAVVAASIVKTTAHRARLRAADVIIARNMDMLAIAAAARLLAGARHVPLAYECLDIHGALTGTGKKSQAMRAAERLLLREVRMLIVSSPGFMRNYFEPVQGYKGPWALWENKLATGSTLPPRPKAPPQNAPESTHAARPADAPIRLGWVGTIRCAPSLDILTQTASAQGARIEIHIHGVIHHHVLPDFDATISRHQNITFHGAYNYPHDLARIYDNLDLVWSQDLWQSGNNSDWLLPNRIYEASWAGCPSIAVTTTETGHRIAEDSLGWVIDTADAESLITLLQTLSPEDIAARRADLLARPDETFVQTPTDIEDVIQRILDEKEG